MAVAEGHPVVVAEAVSVPAVDGMLVYIWHCLGLLKCQVIQWCMRQQAALIPQFCVLGSCVPLRSGSACASLWSAKPEYNVLYEVRMGPIECQLVTVWSPRIL